MKKSDIIPIGILYIVLIVILCIIAYDSHKEKAYYSQIVSIFERDNNLKLEFNFSDEKLIEFIKDYPVNGVTISDSEFESRFTFTEQKNWYPNSVKEFLEMDKTSFRSWTPVEGYEGDIYGEDFILSYRENKDGIQLLFSNQVDGIEVKMEIPGAKRPKEVCTFVGNSDYKSMYYLVFSIDDEVMAISQDMHMYMVK